jgi:hypothetical protein
MTSNVATKKATEVSKSTTEVSNARAYFKVHDMGLLNIDGTFSKTVPGTKKVKRTPCAIASLQASNESSRWTRSRHRLSTQ